MKISLSKILEPEFNNGLKKLYELEDIPFLTARDILNNVKIIEKETEAFMEYRQKLITKYADKYGDGSLVLDENGNATFTQEGIENFNEDIVSNISQDLDLNLKKIKINVEILDKLKISPKQLYWLEDILEPVEEEATEFEMYDAVEPVDVDF